MSWLIGCLFLVLLWWPQPQQRWWPGFWTVIILGSVLLMQFHLITVPIILSLICLWIWLEIVQIILVRRFQNVGKARIFNIKVLILVLVDLLVVWPLQVHTLLTLQSVGMLTKHVLLLATVVNGLVTIGLLIFWLIVAVLPVIVRSDQRFTAIVVLGAGLHDGRVPPILASRLETASKIWRANPGTEIVVSGGRLRGDQISEAAAMARYLVEKCHVPEERILLEEQAHNTWQNLQLSKQLLQANHIESSAIAIVTSSFHAIRAWQYCRRQHLSWQMIAAPTPLGHQPMAVTRDYLGIIRDHRWLALLAVIIAFILVEEMDR